MRNFEDEMCVIEPKAVKFNQFRDKIRREPGMTRWAVCMTAFGPVKVEADSGASPEEIATELLGHEEREQSSGRRIPPFDGFKLSTERRIADSDNKGGSGVVVRTMEGTFY